MTLNTPSSNQDNISWFHQAANAVVQGLQDIAQPFAKVPITIAAGAATGLAQLFGGSKAADKVRQQATSKGVDIPLLGNVKPFGADQYQDFKNGNITKGQMALRTSEDVLANGAQIASWFVGLGEEETAAEVAEEAMIPASQALKTAAKTLWGKAYGFIKNAIPFSVIQSASAGLESQAKGQGALQTTSNTLTSFAGNMMGLLAFKGIGNLLIRGGAKILQSPVIAAANRNLMDTISKYFGLDLKGGLTKATPTIVNEIQKEVDNAHKQLVAGVGDEIKTKTNIGAVWDKIKSTMESSVQQMFNAPKDLFNKFYASAPNVTDFSESAGLIKEAQDLLDKKYGGSVTGLKGNELRSALEQQSNRSNSPLQQWLDTVVSGIGQDGKKIVPANEVERLILKLENIAPASESEQRIINQFKATLPKDMIANLDASGNKAIADIYRSGQKASNFLQDNVQKGIVDNLRKMGANIKSLLSENFFTKTPNADQAEAFLTAIGGKDSENAKAFSSLLHDMAIEWSQKVKGNVADGGSKLEDFLNNWKNTGLLTDEHFNQLSDYATLMQNKAEDYLNAIQGLVGEKTGAVDTKLGTQATSLETKTSQLKNLKVFVKEMGGQKLYETNPDGTLNMGNLVSALTKANQKGETFTGILDELKKVNPEKVDVNKAKEILKIGMGSTLVHLGHPWWGIGMAFKGLENVLSGGGKVSAKDVANMVGDLVGKVDKNGKPYLNASILTDLMSDKLSVVKKTVRKLFEATGGKTTQETTGNQ